MLSMTNVGAVDAPEHVGSIQSDTDLQRELAAVCEQPKDQTRRFLDMIATVADEMSDLISGSLNITAVRADGQVRGYAISGSEVTFSVNNTASSLTFGGQSDHIFAVDADNFGNRVAAVGFRGEVVIWNSESQQTTTRFIAAPVSK